MSQANESQATDKTNQIKYQNFRNKQSIMRQNIQKNKEEKPTKNMTAKKTWTQKRKWFTIIRVSVRNRKGSHENRHRDKKHPTLDKPH